MMRNYWSNAGKAEERVWRSTGWKSMNWMADALWNIAHYLVYPLLYCTAFHLNVSCDFLPTMFQSRECA